MRTISVLAVVALAGLMQSAGVTGKTVEKADMDRLNEGNRRYVSGVASKKGAGDAFREELAKGQSPYAVIVACSDSRVAPEVIFDEDLGRLFVIRTAGNVVDAVALGSIEYAVKHLGTPLVLVVGHESCGAVKAAVDHEGELHGNIGEIIRLILPAVEAARERAKGAEVYKEAVKENVKAVMTTISTKSPVVKEALAKKKVAVKGAYYSISLGKVTIIE